MTLFHTGIVYFLFFISGIAALIYEVVWIRMLVSSFGATVQAVSMVVTAFMAGLALGGWVFGRWIDRQRNPILIYGFLEAGIGISAFILPFLLGVSEKAYTALYQAFPNSLSLASLARFFLSFIPLLIPTTLMGATFPVMSKHFARNPHTIGPNVGTLYSLNVLGAVVGAYLAGFFLIGRFGLPVTVFSAAGLNALSAVLAFTLVRGTRGGAVEGKEPTSVPCHDPGLKDSSRPTRFMWAVFFATGFTSLAFQILWTKGLALFVDNTVYSYSAMLATFLAGLGVGGFVWARFLKWEDHLLFRLAVLQWAIGAYGAMTLFIFHGLARFHFADNLFRTAGDNVLAFSLPYFATTIPVLFIPTFLMGLSFPLIVKILVQDLRVLGARLGQAYAVNTVGAIAGSLLAGFFLLPLMGIQKSILLVSTINVGIGAFLVLKSEGPDRSRRKIFWAGAAAFVVLVVWGVKVEKPLILSTSTFLEKSMANGISCFIRKMFPLSSLFEKQEPGRNS
ncbi:MAG: fused MFS/spermidine synthase [Elusimicrobia bacterium]|nr:fused MFS/spermidine synthase [Elusimicrobiota bacterium]